MNAYIIESRTENGQITIDLPINLHNKNIKITVDEIVSTMPSEEALENVHSVFDQVEGIVPARKKVDLTQLIGAFNKKPTDLNDSLEEQDEDESDFWQPRQRTDITKLRGALKLNMTIDEVDSLTKSWRNEWERDFS